MAKCGYCGQTIPLSATGRFERHLSVVGLPPCQGTGCAPEETTG
jgi:hypothetical protein